MTAVPPSGNKATGTDGQPETTALGVPFSAAELTIGNRTTVPAWTAMALAVGWAVVPPVAVGAAVMTGTVVVAATGGNAVARGVVVAEGNLAPVVAIGAAGCDVAVGGIAVGCVSDAAAATTVARADALTVGLAAA